MWSRIVEVMLACWLAISPFVFGYTEHDRFLWANAFGCAGLVMALSLLSLVRRFDKAHLGILPIAAWLAGHTYLGGAAAPPPAPYQNQLVVALLFAMLAVLPTRSQEPPPAWLEYQATRGRSIEPYGLPSKEGER